MQTICVENPVKHVVPIMKNAAQACDIGVGQGTRRPQILENTAAGRRLLFTPDVKPSTRFSDVRNRVFGANGLQRNANNHESD